MNDANHRDRVTALDRVGATPLRDLFRGRITGRLNVDILMRDAEMPATLHGIIRQTVRRTRLLRLEKSEVASELIAHFRDGLEAGHSSDALVGAFGDPRTAARLIRRAKKRDRSFPLKATIASFKAVAALMLLLILSYLVLAARYYGVKRGPVVDYLPQLTAAARAVPENQRAWPIYRQVLIEYDLRSGMDGINWDARPGWRDWPAITAMLREHEGALKLIREGALRQGLGYVPRPGYSIEDRELWPGIEGAYSDDRPLSGSVMEVLLPHLGEIRKFAQYLAADTRLAASEADSDRAKRNLLALVSLADQIREIPFIISDLVSISVVNLGVAETMELLHDHPELLSEGDLRNLAHAFGGYPSDGEPLVRMRGDRLLFEDVVQRLYSLNSNGNGVMVAGSLTELESLSGEIPSDGVVLNLAGPVASAVVANRKDTLRFHRDYFDSTEAWIRTPAWERPTLDDPFDGTDTLVGRARHALAFALTPAVGHALRQGEQFDQQRNAALVAIAVELFRRSEGRLPNAISELTPRFLPSVPVDMFDGAPLKYRVNDESFVLYSIGNDYIDDEGRAAAPHTASTWLPKNEAARRIAIVKSGDAELMKQTKSGSRAPGVGDGDWVLFPLAPKVEPPPRYEYDDDLARPQSPDASEG